MRLVCLFVYTSSSGLIYMRIATGRSYSVRETDALALASRSFRPKKHSILRVLAWLFLAK